MNDLTLQLGENSFKLKFGLKLFRILGRKWNLPGINETVLKMACLDGASTDLTFDQLDVIEDLLCAAIEAGNDENIDLSNIDIIDEFFKNPNALQTLTQQLVESLPQQKEELGKPKVAKKATNK